MEDDDMLRASGVSAHIVEAKAAMNADVRVVIKVAPGYHTAEIPAKRGIPEGAHSSPDDFGLQTAGLPRGAPCGGVWSYDRRRARRVDFSLVCLPSSRVEWTAHRGIVSK